MRVVRCANIVKDAMKRRVAAGLWPAVSEKSGRGVTLDDLKGKLLANGLLGSVDSVLKRLDQVTLTHFNQRLVHGALRLR
jgi:hypothetical protein